jgi:acetoacetate decarboxylase
MGRVRYVRNFRDIERAEAHASLGPVSIRSLVCVYETDAEVVSAVVPKPLEVLAQPEVEVRLNAFLLQVADDVSIEIRTGCVGIRVEYDRAPGLYPLTMTTTSEAGMIAGREQFGEPLKMADIKFSAAADHVSAGIDRMGIEYLRVVGRRVEDLGPREEHAADYCFKAFPSADVAKDFDQDPQLVRVERHHQFETVSRVEGGIELWDSPYDPVADLPVRRLVSLEYCEGKTTVTGRALRPVPGDWLIPFLHQRDDHPGTIGVDV